MITCPICNKLFKQLTNTHLKKSHNLSMQDFDRLYPNFTKQTNDIYSNTEKMNQRIIKYNKSPNRCTHCDNPIEYEKRRNKFCSSSCSASFNNSNRELSDDTKKKISKTLSDKHTPNLHELICSSCGKEFLHKKVNKKTCSSECNHKIQIETLKYNAVKAGQISASIQVKRSKNEIELFNLLASHYDCLHNIPLFNGWDADIIIPSLNLAILWNGPWHYIDVMKGHSFKQTFNRDLIKLSEIQKKNYNFIIVKDYNNKMNPELAFQIIQSAISNKSFNMTIL